MSRIKITDTSLRDAHQSLWATRMTTEDILPILKQLDNTGYHSLEVWGGATFDVCLRYLKEDPWERLRAIRREIVKTKLQMLLRGQSLLGYAHYPDDIVEKFIEKSAENGIDIFRIFDALNDLRNLKVPIEAARKTGKHVQACVVYTISPVHTLDHFVETAKELKAMGADSICIKDMAGLLSPYVSFELVKALKESIDLPIQLHTHYIGGMAIATLLKAIEAGADIIDTATVPLAFGSSQPPVETIVRALQDTEWNSGLELGDLFAVADYFEKIRKQKGFERGVTRITDMKVFDHQIPGGMITNLYSQLEEQKAVDRWDDVLHEIPQVRKDLGYPPLVTPTSQIIGIQAVMNVLTGERYKMCPGEVKDYVRGLYGNPPAPINEEVKWKIIGDLETITVRPADLLPPAWEKCQQEAAQFAQSDEDVLTYALFPQVALKYFEYRQNKEGTEQTPAVAAETMTGQKTAAVQLPGPKNGKRRSGGDGEMDLEDIKELILLLDSTSIGEINLQRPEYSLLLRKSAAGTIDDQAGTTLIPADWKDNTADMSRTIPHKANCHEVTAPIVGTFYEASSPDAPAFVQLGDQVESGQILCIVEAMKLMNEIKADVDGKIVEIAVGNGDTVEYGQILFLIETEQG